MERSAFVPAVSPMWRPSAQRISELRFSCLDIDLGKTAPAWSAPAVARADAALNLAE